tara:strand:+ start:189 stop:428 length:240 start_codon:yes stop_codon:yes gene_type:complete
MRVRITSKERSSVIDSLLRFNIPKDKIEIVEMGNHFGRTRFTGYINDALYIGTVSLRRTKANKEICKDLISEGISVDFV